MRHVRDIKSPRSGKFIRFIAADLSPFEGEVSTRAGKNGGPIIVAPDGSEREFLWAHGDRIERIAARPWGHHGSAPPTVCRIQATHAIESAQRRARLATYTAAALAAASLALVAALTLSGGLIP